VFLTTDLSTKINVGLPFSSKEGGGKVHDAFFKGMDDDLAIGDYLAHRPNLSYLPERHVLMLNTSLTTGPEPEDKVKHIDAWRPFITEIIKSFDKKENKPVCFILVGDYAEEYMEYIDELKHEVLRCEHPVDAVAEMMNWRHDNVFSQAREFVRKYYDQKLLW
jgi:uracil DNA glycosylase